MIFDERGNTEIEKDQILKITQQLYPNSEFATSEYFDWQYRDGPYGPAKIALANKGRTPRSDGASHRAGAIAHTQSGLAKTPEGRG